MRLTAAGLGLVLAIFTTNALADDTVDDLIRKLADREPTVRAEASDRLRALGKAADPALRMAAQSPRPAIADAALALLMERRWFELNAPPIVVRALGNYGRSAPLDRAALLQSLLRADANATRETVLNVLMRDPSESVSWQTLGDFMPDAEWLALLKPIDLKTLPQGLKVFYGRGLFQLDDAKRGLQILNDAIDRETIRPVATAPQLARVIDILVDTDIRNGKATRAVERLRLLRTRGSDTDGGQQMVSQILVQQVRHGPLRGLAQDLYSDKPIPNQPSTLALAALSAEMDAPIAHDALVDLWADKASGEQQDDYTQRMLDTGTFLVLAGAYQDAIHALDKVTQFTNSDQARQKATNAYVQLHQAHRLQKSWQESGDALQRVVNTMPPQSVLTNRLPNGATEVWSHEDVQARIAWCYFMQAKSQGDSANMKKFAELAMASASTDGSIFLDVLPTLESASDAGAVDVYFQRVYENAKAMLEAHPNHPQALNEVAWTCGRAGRRLSEAAGYIDRALKLMPNESAFLDTAAEIKFRQGAASEALKLELRAVDLMPEDVFMHEQIVRFRQVATTQAGN